MIFGQFLVKLHLPSVVPFASPFLSSACLQVFVCPLSVLVLPLFCPELAVESVQDPVAAVVCKGPKYNHFSNLSIIIMFIPQARPPLIINLIELLAA